MKVYNKRNIAEWAALALLLAVVLLVFQQIATSLTEQGAASGDAFSNSALFPEMVAELLFGLLCLQAFFHFRASNRINSAEQFDDAAQDPELESPAQLRRMLYSIIALVVIYLLLLVPLGFHITTTAVMTAMFAVLGARPLWWALIAGAGTSLLFGIVFEIMLNVVLPVGVFAISLPTHLGN